MGGRGGEGRFRAQLSTTSSQLDPIIKFCLYCGEFQINYFKDHVKLILCPLMGAVTVIDERKNFRTFKLSLLAEHGCTSDLMHRLQYAHEKLPFLLAPLDPTASTK